MNRWLSGALAAIFLGAAPVHAEGGADGEALYQSVCRNCHGPTAMGMASFPKLAGQPAEYLRERLEQYRAGEKVGYNTALMAPHAAELSDEQIEALASYIATGIE